MAAHRPIKILAVKPCEIQSGGNTASALNDALSDCLRRPQTGRFATVFVLVALLGFVLTGAARAQDQAKYKIAWEMKTGLDMVNTPLLVNLTNTPMPEIVLTDRSGRIEIRDSESGKLLCAKKVAEAALTSPVAGDFLGDSRLHIAVATNDGRVIFLDGGTLDLISDAQVAPNVQITAQPLVIDAPNIDPKLSSRSELVITDTSGNVRCYYLDDRGLVKRAWESACGARPIPAAAGFVRTKEMRDVVLAAENEIVILEGSTGKAYKRYIRGKSIRVTPALVDLDADGLQEIVLADDGAVCVVKFDQTEQAIKFFWPGDLPWSSLSAMPSIDPIVVHNRGAEPSLLLVQGAGNSVYCFYPLGKTSKEREVWQNPPMPGSVKTYLSAIPRQDRSPIIAFGDDKKNIWLIESASGKNLLDPATNSRAFSYEKGPFENLLVAGCVDPEGKISLWGATGGRATLVRFDLQPIVQGLLSTPGKILWGARGGNVWHTGTIDLDYQNWEAARQQNLEKVRQEKEDAYKAASKASEHQAALAAALWLKRYNPYEPLYATYYRTAWVRKNLLILILSTALGILVVGYTSFKSFQLGQRTLRLRKAESARAAGRFDEAAMWYEKVREQEPKNPKINTALAQVYIAQKNYGSSSLPIYQAASKSNPDAADLLHAFAHALAQVPETNDDAMQVYQKAVVNSPEPELMEYALGCCHAARKEWNDAAKHLRAALRGGYQDDRVYASLCDVYLALDYRQAKAVPVFKQQYARRVGDQRFLEAYLDSCADAKLSDAETEALCRQVIEGNSNYINAYCLMTRIRLQRHDTDGAAQAIDQALQIDPDHADALFLRSQVNLIEGRTDERAIDQFLRTLAHYPSDRDILRTVSHAFARAQRYDATAIDIYKRAAAENPNDAPTLRALAEVGRLTRDPAMTIDTIERLANLGQMNNDLTLLLAAAYVATNCVDPKVERVLRDALRIQPDNPSFAMLLAYTLLQQDKTDADAAAIYERAIVCQPQDVAVGRQLVKTYNQINRYADSLTLAQRLLGLAPDDEELKRFLALASLYGNRIDQAIEEYKRILSRNPQDRDAIINLALAYAQKGMTDDNAARVYQQALALSPNNDNLHLIMAKVQAVRGDLVRCVEFYQQALKSQPNIEDKVLAHCAGLLGEFPQALRVRWFYCELLVAYNRLRDALDQLAIILESSPAQARNVLGAIDKVLAKDPKSILALLRRGELLQKMDQLADARATLERAFTLQPSSPEVQAALISCYEAYLKTKDDAEVRFRLGKLFFLNQDYDRAIGCFQRTSQDYRWEAESIKMLGKSFMGKGMFDLSLQEFKKLVVDEETKELLYELAQRYEQKRDLVGAKTVYRQLFAADINYRDVRQRFEMLSGSTSDPAAFEKTSIVQQMSEEAQRRYELLDELGRGAMGIVYRARDKELDEVVALKILPDSLSNNPEAVRRFKIEAKNARRLSHPNIVRIHDIGEEMGRKYISMEIVEGTDLKKKLRAKGKFGPREAVEYSIQIADALACAHRLGVVHRDIKPANIMITKKNEIKVTDFGIAKLVDSATGEGTMIGAVIGTPLYMSPEQVQGIPVDNRADIYSFGVMFYEFLNGKPPFTEGDLAYQHIHKPPDPIPGCPKPLWDIIAKCLEKNKESRWANAEEIVDTLKPLLKTLPADAQG